MEISFSELKSSQIYHLMIQTVVPRPIAWVLTKNIGGSYNLAPFSYFNAISSAPPILMFSTGKKMGEKEKGEKKDTWKNIEREGEFVVLIPSVAQAQAVSGTAKELAFGESEVTDLGLEMVDFTDGWQRPKGSKVAYHCQLERILEIGKVPQGVIFGEIKSLFVDDSIVQEKDGRLSVDVVALDPLARLGGANYAPLGKPFSVPRA